MSELTLDFTDASFDADPAQTYIIDPSDNLVYEMQADGTAGASQLLDRGTGQNVSKDSTGINAISSMAMSVPVDTSFAFEFLDSPEDDGTSNDDVRSQGDQYTASGDVSGKAVTLFMNEAMFEAGLDVTNGDTFKIAVTEVSGGGTTTTTTTNVTPVSVHYEPQVAGQPLVPLGTLGHNGSGWVFEQFQTGGNQIYSPMDWSGVTSTMTGASGGQLIINGTPFIQKEGSFFDDSALLTGMTNTTEVTVTETATSISYDTYVGDGEGETWVLSGDLNGRDPYNWQGGDTGTNDIIGFRPGTYDGIFLGGDGFDTLRFDHQNGSDTAQMYVDLSSGIAMFGNGQRSPLVEFAETGVDVTYDLDWERLQMEGDSNDIVVVGGGLNLEGTNTDVTLGDDEMVEGYFELDLGSGEDRVMVTDSSSLINLDMSATGANDVLLANGTYDGNTVTTVSGASNLYAASHEIKEDGSTGDQSLLSVEGQITSGGSAVIDYIHFGEGTSNQVTNQSAEGVVVSFGTTGQNGDDKFDARGSSSNSNMIDLREIDGAIDIKAHDDNIGYHRGITQDRNDNGDGQDPGDVDIIAHDVDLLYVSQLGGDGKATVDADVLVDASHLYGDNKGVLGFDVVDADGSDYDVITSARLNTFDGDNNLQIFYDGDHNSFIDTGDQLSRDAHNYNVATTGVNAQQEGWAAATESDTGGAATPSFYVVVNGKKVNVHLDQTDAASQWKVDTTAFGIANDTTVSGSPNEIAARLTDGYGVEFEPSALSTGMRDIYLNATETDITTLLNTSASDLDGMEAVSAFDFGFYTQVQAKDGSYVNIGIKAVETAGVISWEYDNEDVLVKTDYNTVITDGGDGTAAVGGMNADFVELGAGDGNIAMGNGGSDTYQVGDATDEGIINELGDILGREQPASGAYTAPAAVTMPHHSDDEDSVQFELVEDMAMLDFSRGSIAGEKDGSTLFISTDGAAGKATLFDQYNEFLSFRKTEYLVIDDGATSNEVFELVTGNDATTNLWENEIYVAHDNETINVDLGGIDHVFLGDGAANAVSIDLDAVLGTADSGSVTINGMEGDTLQVFGGGEYGDGTASSQVMEAYDAIKAKAALTSNTVDSAKISWDGKGGLTVDAYNELDQAIDTTFLTFG